MRVVDRMSIKHQVDRERSFALAQRTFELMRDYGSSASPRSYAVWYAYVSGSHPLMNDAVKRLTTQHGALTDADMDHLHATYIDRRAIGVVSERTNANLIAEVEGIMEVLDLSLGATAQYGESLKAYTNDLASSATNRNRLREIVAALIADTRDVAANNRTLEARMREGRDEIESLRGSLEAARLETLTDPLTGLGNRKCLEESLHREIDGPASGRLPASLIFIDIDFFKRFNDLYGHLTGDQVLRLVAMVMREHVTTARVTLARFGGEEFGVVLPETDRASARTIAETIRRSVMGRELVKRSTGESLGKVTISLGLATQEPGDTSVSLLERADACLYAAKRAGRNRTVDETQHALLANVA